jgi:excisionase family DNA binding protein
MALNRYELLERLRGLLAAQDGTKPIPLVAPGTPSMANPAVDWADRVQHPVATAQASAPRLLLTVPEACAELRISRAQLYILANKQRVIEMVHIGKLARIPRTSLEAYVEQLRQQQQPATRLALDRGLCA